MLYPRSLLLPFLLFMDGLLDDWPLDTDTSTSPIIIDPTVEELYDFLQQMCRGDVEEYQ